KLLASGGLLVAPASIPTMLLATALAGGVLCLPYLPGRALFAAPAAGRPSGFLARVLRCERWRLRRRGPLPYAVAIVAGTMFALLQGA
ncbi:MAG: peptidase A24, partial [Geminicoccaceae bacterium]